MGPGILFKLGRVITNDFPGRLARCPDVPPDADAGILIEETCRHKPHRPIACQCRQRGAAGIAKIGPPPVGPPERLDVFLARYPFHVFRACPMDGVRTGPGNFPALGTVALAYGADSTLQFENAGPTQTATSHIRLSCQYV